MIAPFYPIVFFSRAHVEAFHFDFAIHQNNDINYFRHISDLFITSIKRNLYHSEDITPFLYTRLALWIKDNPAFLIDILNFIDYIRPRIHPNSIRSICDFIIKSPSRTQYQLLEYFCEKPFLSLSERKITIDLVTHTTARISQRIFYLCALHFPIEISHIKYKIRNQLELERLENVNLDNIIENESQGFESGTCFGFACAAITHTEPTRFKLRFWQGWHAINVKFSILKNHFTGYSTFPKLQRNHTPVTVLESRRISIHFLYRLLQSKKYAEGIIFLIGANNSVGHFFYLNFSNQYIMDNQFRTDLTTIPKELFNKHVVAYVHTKHCFRYEEFQFLEVIENS